MKKSNRFSKGLAGILAVGAMCAALPMLSSSAALTGDVNLDGKVSVEDVVLLQKYLMKKATISKDAFNNADMNGDKKVNIYDLISQKKPFLLVRPNSRNSLLKQLNQLPKNSPRKQLLQQQKVWLLLSFMKIML